jgi:hypothetical protein
LRRGNRRHVGAATGRADLCPSRGALIAARNHFQRAAEPHGAPRRRTMV